jgi:hypothetical protein
METSGREQTAKPLHGSAHMVNLYCAIHLGFRLPRIPKSGNRDLMPTRSQLGAQALNMVFNPA